MARSYGRTSRRKLCRHRVGAEAPGERPEQAAGGIREQEFQPQHLHGAGDDAVQLTQHDHEAGGDYDGRPRRWNSASSDAIRSWVSPICAPKRTTSARAPRRLIR
jgi:hypothetical protein